jgi:hypothetical protein
MAEHLIKRLRACAEDPMWANHAEVPKSLLSAAAAELERLATVRDGLWVELERLRVSASVGRHAVLCERERNGWEG